MRRSTLLAAGTVSAAALFIPAIAGATTASITADCAAVTFTYRDFGVGGQARPTYAVTVDGVTAAGTFEPPSGPFTQRTYPLNLQGTHTVSASTEGRPGINAFASFGPATFVCGSPAPGPTPAPVPASGEQSPSDGQPVDAAPAKPAKPSKASKGKSRKETCADLRAQKAGRKWLVKRGCVKSRIGISRVGPDKPPPYASLIGHNPRPPVAGSKS